MKILVVTPAVDMTTVKGDSIHLRNVLAEWMREHEVHLVSATPDGRVPIDLSSHVSVHRTNDGDGKEETIRRLGRSAIEVIRQCRSADFDLVYERHHMVGTGIPGAKLSGTPRVVEVNGILPREHAIKGNLPPVIIRSLERVERVVLSQSENIVCVSPKVRRYLLEYGLPPDALHTVPNGVDTDTFHPIADAKDQLGWESDRTYVGFVGSLKPWHGVDQLIDGVATLSDPHVTLVIIGDGPEKAALERRAKTAGLDDSVVFTGRVPYENVPLYLSALDVGCVLKHPKIPGSPLKLYEYLACGTPVIATDDSDFSVVSKRDVGTRIEYGNSEAIATALSTVPSWGNEIRTRARRVATERSWSTVAKEALQAATTRH